MLNRKSVIDLPAWFNRIAHSLNLLALGGVIGSVITFATQGKYYSDYLAGGMTAGAVIYGGSWLYYWATRHNRAEP